MGRNDLITGNVWEEYSKKVQERMNKPLFLGEFSEEEAQKENKKLIVADFGAEACGDAVRLYWLVDENDTITDARYKSFGCGTAIASSDVMTELTIGKTVDEAMKITNLDVEKALRDTPDIPAFPPQKMHCSVMAYDVILEAAAKYKGCESDMLRDNEIVCECARVTKKEIEDLIKAHDIKDLKTLHQFTKAGTYCKSCNEAGGHEEKSIYLIDLINNLSNAPKVEQIEPEEKPFTELSIFNKMKAVDHVIDTLIKPSLAKDGGSVEVIDIFEEKEDTVVKLKYLGACASCDSSMMTLFSIEGQLKTALETEKIRVLSV